MGSSAYAKLVFGVDVEDVKDKLPWREPEFMDIDDEGDEWWRVETGFVLDESLDFDGQWEQRKAWDKEHPQRPFEMEYHGSAYDDDSGCVLVLRGRNKSVSCGEIEVISAQDLQIPADQVLAFVVFLTALGITDRKPTWMLLSSYG